MTREDELIRSIREGRQEALDELIEQFYPEVLRYCLWHTADRESAQDAAQETFLKMVRHLNRYEPRGQFRAFLYKIAANTCIDMKRSHVWMVELPEECCYQEDGFRAAEDRLQLTAAFRRLDGTERELVLLKYGQGLSFQEVATVMGIPMRTVQSRLYKAVRKLRKELER